MPANIETMAYATDVKGGVWHGLGTAVDHAMTSAEALQLAGLDWEVEKKQLVYEDGTVATDAYGIRRASDGKHFGKVGPIYEVYQNRDAFNFMDALVQDGVMRYESAMALKGGALVVLLGRMMEDWHIGPDLHRTYMMFDTTHDGTGAVHGTPTDVRAICMNTWKQARADGGSLAFSVRHTETMQERLARAAQAYSISTAATRAMQEWLGKALDTPMAKGTADEIMVAMFGDPEKVETERQRQTIADKRDVFTRKFVMPEFNRTGNSAYTLFNAATGYADWALTYRNGKNDKRMAQEARFIGALDGKGARMKDAAVKVLTAAMA